MELMTTPPSATTERVVRDSKSGRFVTVRGVGALKGNLKIKKGVDLTKPIAAQTTKGRKERDGACARTQP